MLHVTSPQRPKHGYKNGFKIALKNIVEPNQHKLAAKLMREIADSQPFHMEVYYEVGLFCGFVKSS